MKTALFTLALLSFLSASTALAQNSPSPASASNPLVGTWKLVSQKLVWPDSTQTADDKTIDQLKIITATHFSFINVHVPSRKFSGAGAGRCTMQGNTYTENIEYSSSASMRGQRYSFTIHLSGDRFTQSGKIGTVQLDEVWQRIK